MSFYTVLFRKTFLKNFQYRASTMITNAGGLIFGFMYIAIWQGTLGPDQSAAGLTRAEMAQYVMFQQTLFTLMFLPRGFLIDEGVRTGSVALELMRPVNFYGYHLTQAYAFMAYNSGFRALPIIAALSLAFGIPAMTLQTVPLLVLSILMAAYIAFLMNYFMGIAAFWTNSIRWAFIVNFTMNMTFSGFLVPPPVLPSPFDWLAAYSPYAGMHYYPGLVFLGYPAWQAYLVPLVWMVILTAVALWLTRKARRKMEIQGG